jgi:hypothetical protein
VGQERHGQEVECGDAGLENSLTKHEVEWEDVDGQERVTMIKRVKWRADRPRLRVTIKLKSQARIAVVIMQQISWVRWMRKRHSLRRRWRSISGRMGSGLMCRSARLILECFGITAKGGKWNGSTLGRAIYTISICEKNIKVALRACWPLEGSQWP